MSEGLSPFVYLSQRMDVPKKYRDLGHFRWIHKNYITLFEFCKQQNYKRVLDFGCGIGMSQVVYDYGDYPFELRLGDMDTDWNGEKATFDAFRDNYSIHYSKFTDICKPNFTFLDEPDIKFDCVIATRFPPLSNLNVSTDDFKERLAPYCEDNFDLVYANISRVKADRLNMNYDIPLYDMECKHTYDDNNVIKLMVF